MTDRHHFDNPVYCYPTGVNGATAGATGVVIGGIGGSATTSGLNNARIRNDLGATKSNLTNLERAKLGAHSIDDECSEGKQLQHTLKKTLSMNIIPVNNIAIGSPDV